MVFSFVVDEERFVNMPFVLVSSVSVTVNSQARVRKPFTRSAVAGEQAFDLEVRRALQLLSMIASSTTRLTMFYIGMQ